MSKTKELIICIISIIVLCLAIATNVFATETPDLNSLMANNNTENNNFEQIGEATNNTNINTNTNVNTNTNTNINANINANTNTNTTKSIPYTGIDYSVIVIIAICGVSAVYAYKKIRDYNV